MPAFSVTMVLIVLVLRSMHAEARTQALAT
jgi:hypothetical protein